MVRSKEKLTGRQGKGYYSSIALRKRDGVSELSFPEEMPGRGETETPLRPDVHRDFGGAKRQQGVSWFDKLTTSR